MAKNDYHFMTHWQVKSTVEEVANILTNPTDLVRWWPSVYLHVQEVEPGDENGIGRVFDLYTRGWLPYTLRWQSRVTKYNYPHDFALEASGDLAGRGIWSLEQEGEWVKITYDWKVRADKPLLSRLSFLLKPFFAANHNWAMAKGEESLKLELARRRAQTEEERQRIPRPPGFRG